jgi:hypothetical protein
MFRSILTGFVIAAAAAALAAGGANAADPPAAAQFSIDIGTSEAAKAVRAELVGFSRGGTVAYAYQHNQTDLEFLRAWQASGQRRDVVLVVRGPDGQPTARFRLRSALAALSPQAGEGIVEISFDAAEVLPL